jgi:hypothetical protein
VVGTAGTIYPNMMAHPGLVVQTPGGLLRAAAQLSYIGERQASENNILLGGRAYTLPDYWLLEAKPASLRSSRACNNKLRLRGSLRESASRLALPLPRSLLLEILDRESQIPLRVEE